MAKIPSIRATRDFIFRKAIEKGHLPVGTDSSHLLVVDGFFDASTSSDEPIESLGSFHSMDVSIFRDGKGANDVELIILRHQRNEMSCWYSLELSDAGNVISEHEYLVTIILRYLI